MNENREIATRTEPPFDWKTLPPEILARAASIQAQAQAQGGFITPPQALAAAYHFASTGEIAGRHAYVIPAGKAAGQVWESYRGVTRELDMSRYQFRYRPMSADERELNGVIDTWMTVVCELDVLEARRQCIQMQIPYAPILGIGIVTPQDRNRPAPNARTWYWVCQKRARVDALRQVGENTSADEVLEEAAANGIHTEAPTGARLTQAQAEHAVRAAQTTPTPLVPPLALGQPAGFQGFGDDNPNAAAFDAIPGASANLPPATPIAPPQSGPRVSNPNPPTPTGANGAARAVAKLAIIKTKLFFDLAQDLARQHPYYRNTRGDPDTQHMCASLGQKLGVAEITAANVLEAMALLADHATAHEPPATESQPAG